MNPETIQSIKDALAPVAEKIGQGAEYGWTTLVWGQFAEGVASLICVAVALSIFIALNIATHRIIIKAGLDYSDRTFAHVAHLLIGSFVGAIVIGVSLDVAYDAVIQVVAPEYSAIKFLLSLAVE